MNSTINLENIEGGKAEKYAALQPQIEAVVSGEDDIIANMANVAAMLDIDSEHLSSFDETDKLWLERIVPAVCRSIHNYVDDDFVKNL